MNNAPAAVSNEPPVSASILIFFKTKAFHIEWPFATILTAYTVHVTLAFFGCNWQHISLLRSRPSIVLMARAINW